MRGLLGGALLGCLLSFGDIFGRRGPAVGPVARVDAVPFGVCHLSPGLLGFRVGERLSAAGFFALLGLCLLELSLGGQGIVLEERAGDFFHSALNGGHETLTGVLCLTVLGHISSLRTTDEMSRRLSAPHHPKIPRARETNPRVAYTAGDLSMRTGSVRRTALAGRKRAGAETPPATSQSV